MNPRIYVIAVNFLIGVLTPAAAQADTPPGWINAANPSAYTATQGKLELRGSVQVVNSTIDFLNIREDLLASNQRLVGNSGDLIGIDFETHYGITDSLSVFGRYRQHELTADLGEFSSINVLEIDESLDTTQKEIGLRWMFWESDLLAPESRKTGISLQVTAYENYSDDFDVVIDQLTIDSLIVRFLEPTTFSVSDMEDDGWTAKVIYTNHLDRLGTASFWLGYGESSATSGTSTNAGNGTIKQLVTQDFLIEEEYFYLGASLSAQLTPRLPLTVSYEYIDISESKFSRKTGSAPSSLPGFLTSSGTAMESANHTLNARLSYWITPDINVGLTGSLFSNQFLGRLPHYNNPLSESFSSTPYGFIGLELGLNW